MELFLDILVDHSSIQNKNKNSKKISCLIIRVVFVNPFSPFFISKPKMWISLQKLPALAPFAGCVNFDTQILHLINRPAT